MVSYISSFFALKSISNPNNIAKGTCVLEHSVIPLDLFNKLRRILLSDSIEFTFSTLLVLIKITNAVKAATDGLINVDGAVDMAKPVDVDGAVDVDRPVDVHKPENVDKPVDVNESVSMN